MAGQNRIADIQVGGERIAKVWRDGETLWERSTPPPPSWGGLKFTAVDPNSTVAMWSIADAPSVTLMTSVDGGQTWQDFVVHETTITLANVGDSVCFKAGEGGNFAFAVNPYGGGGYNCFVLTGKIAASGNINSLLDSDYESVVSLEGRDYCYAYLFEDGDDVLVSAPELPATILSDYCYSYMFFACNSLEVAPELPAVELAKQCYDGMFMGCDSLREMRVRFTDWHLSLLATKSWVAPSVQTEQGKFYCPNELQELRAGNSFIPYAWERIDI